MIRRIARACRQEERGFALITVLLVMLVMSALTVVMVQNIVSAANGNSHQLQVTDALTAADAGVTDLVTTLQQGSNWGSFATSYPGGNTWSTPNTIYGWNAIGNGQYRAHVDGCSVLTSSRQTSSGCQSGDEVVTVQGQFPANTGAIQTVQAVLRNQTAGPQAFSYAMFADKGIQVHHHSDSYISPTIVTSSIHSNGFITLNYPAIYRVGKMEASGAVTIADGGGSTPAGSVTSSYNWPYWISGTDSNNPPRCYPALQYPTLQYPSPGSSNAYWNAPTGSGSGPYGCPAGSPQWSPNAVVVGDIQANSVEIKSHGDTQYPSGQPAVNGNQWTPEATGSAGGCGGTSLGGFQDPVTGACIPVDNGNIDAYQVKFDVGGQTFTGPAQTPANQNQSWVYYNPGKATCPTNSTCNSNTYNTGGLTTCNNCNNGTADTGGYIGGYVNLHPSGYAPQSLSFPSFNYTTQTLPIAVTDQGNSTPCSTTGGTTCHIFSSATTFLTWMHTQSNAYFPAALQGGVTYDPSVNPCTGAGTSYCMTWLTSGKAYTNTLSQVAYVVLRGDYEIQGGTNLSLSESSLRSGFTTPSTAATPTVMVAGALVNESGDISLTASLTVVGATMDPFNPLQPDSELSPTTVPGLLASGGSGNAIQSTDYDTDSPWTSTSNYQGNYRNQVIVRGLVYTGSSSSTASTPGDQHWHNSEPKNAQVIVGAQVGGTLHDCSNFTFSYDPLIENIKGFSGSTQGGIFVLDWVQL